MKKPLILFLFNFDMKQEDAPEGPHVHYTPVEYALFFVVQH